MGLGTIYTPSPWQAKFHATYGVDHVLGAGSAGPGKSLALLYDPFVQIQEEHSRCTDPGHPHPIHKGGSTGLAVHVRRKMQMLHETLSRARRSFELIDPGAKLRLVDNIPTFTFTSGYTYQFRHCHDRYDWENFEGLQITALYFDELTQFHEEQYDHITKRVRSSDPVLKGMLRIASASNPVARLEGGGDSIEVDNPHWVRDRFVKPAPLGNKLLVQEVEMDDGTVEEITSLYLPARLSDNPDPDFRRSYEKKLQGMAKHIKEAYLKGDWFITPGSYYGDDFSHKTHVCKPFRPPMDWKFFRSMDWGYKTQGVIHWWAMDHDGILYCIREFMFSMMTDVDVAKRVLEIEEDIGLKKKSQRRSSLGGPADTQLWEKRGESSISKAEKMSSVGVDWSRADKADKARTAELLGDRIRDRYHEDVPGLVIFESCSELISVLPSVPRDPHHPEKPKKTRNDHTLDSARYASAYCARGPDALPSHSKKKIDSTPPWAAKSDRRGSNYGYGEQA